MTLRRRRPSRARMLTPGATSSRTATVRTVILGQETVGFPLRPMTSWTGLAVGLAGVEPVDHLLDTFRCLFAPTLPLTLP